MNLVFASDSYLTWKMEKEYEILKEQNPDLVQAAQRGQSVIDTKTGQPIRRASRRSRQGSLTVRHTSDARGSATYDEKFETERLG